MRISLSRLGSFSHSDVMKLSAEFIHSSLIFRIEVTHLGTNIKCCFHTDIKLLVGIYKQSFTIGTLNH